MYELSYSSMDPPSVVSREEWLKARLELLKKEKKHTESRDELTRTRQDMPWVKIEKDYGFDGQDGKIYLRELFEGKSQLVVYHFMFEEDWEEGCKSCSFLADHYEPAIIHLANRDVSMITISKASLAKLESFKKRMGWSFKWISSENSDFNEDFHVSFTEKELEYGKGYYNFEESELFGTKEAPGISVFTMGKNGQIYHTYSAYARGLRIFSQHIIFWISYLKGVMKKIFLMEWLRHKDRYGDETFIDYDSLKK